MHNITAPFLCPRCGEDDGFDLTLDVDDDVWLADCCECGMTFVLADVEAALRRIATGFDNLDRLVAKAEACEHDDGEHLCPAHAAQRAADARLRAVDDDDGA